MFKFKHEALKKNKLIAKEVGGCSTYKLVCLREKDQFAIQTIFDIQSGIHWLKIFRIDETGVGLK